MGGEPLATARERLIGDATRQAPPPQHEAGCNPLHHDVALAHTEVDERFRAIGVLNEDRRQLRSRPELNPCPHPVIPGGNGL